MATPLKAIRAKCKDCNGNVSGTLAAIRNCDFTHCALFEYRMATRPVNGSPLRAIRAKCLDCCIGQPKEVRLCPCIECALYPFRFGRRPARRVNAELLIAA